MGSHILPTQHQQQLYIQQHQQQQQQQQQQQPSSSSPITLPPLVSLTNSVPFRNYSNSSTNDLITRESSNEISQPSSPRRGSSINPLAPTSSNTSNTNNNNTSNINGSIPQGLFWKVPYNQGPFDRRNSVDSVSSSLSEARSPRFSSASSSIVGQSSNGSNQNNIIPPVGGGNFIFGQRPSTSYESSIVSDSDDDRGSNYSPRASIDISTRNSRSRSNSTNLQQIPTSPALSVSSMNSFNQGFNRNLNIQNHHQQQQQHPQAPNMLLAQQHQMIESYYQYIHLTFPILPLDINSLINLLHIPQLNSSDANLIEINENNKIIVQCFYSSLNVLLLVTSRSSRSPSYSVPYGNSNINESNFIDVINNNFEILIKLFPMFQSKFHLYSQNIIILFTTTLVLCSYSVTLLGLESDSFICSSISIFNKLKIFKIFWDKSHSSNASNFDDYNSILKRLYILMDIIDSIQSLSFGVPRSMNSIDFNFTTVDHLIPNLSNYNNHAGISSTDFEITRNNLKFGLILSKVCSSRNFKDPSSSSLNKFIASDLKLEHGYFHNILNKNQDIKQIDSIPIDFLDMILCKFELITFLEEVDQSFPNVNINNNLSTLNQIDEELVFDYQLKSLRIVKKHLELQSSILKSIKNYSNSIDSSLLISPYLPILFKQSIKALNLEKIIINSLQINNELIPRLSKPLNELINLNNYLSLLKPFKIDELNNHMKFQFFNSQNIQYLEQNESNKTNTSHSTKLIHWIGLMKEIKMFVQSDDYEGWF